MRKEAKGGIKTIGVIGDIVMGVVYALQDIKWAGEIIIDLKNSRIQNRTKSQRHRWPDLT